ncbi:hypothetical protein ACFYOC_09065 [Nocardiopsis alba]|uniref:hypothetical protein n=1 Tax=Nocardiopsis alba TaxID=53437 RepID=UPI0036A2CFE3
MSYPSGPAPQYGSSSGGSPVSALIWSILMTLCCNQICGIIAIVFSVLAMTKEHEPAEQERFVRYAWRTMGIGLAITVGLVILYFLFGSALALA